MGNFGHFWWKMEKFGHFGIKIFDSYGEKMKNLGTFCVK
jgi:hypothetical protein